MHVRALLAAALTMATGASFAQSQNQDEKIKINALFVAWYTQNTNNNWRVGSPSQFPYYKANDAFKENGFSLRRSEIYLSGKVCDGITANLMFDPGKSSNQLYDAFATWTSPCKRFDVKLGQFKPVGYETTLVSAADVLNTDRSQLARFTTDNRDRGLMASMNFGDKEFTGRLGLGVFNGTDRANDANAQKDYALRADFKLGKEHKFGAYALMGVTDASDRNQSPAALLPGTSADQIRSNRDATTTYGLYYAFDYANWHADAEVATGLLGRRFPTLGLGTVVARREHLDQKFLSYCLTGAYTMQNNMFRLRYDFINFNQGDKWNGPVNPYITNGDFTPKFTEVTLGYTYIFNPAVIKNANIKLDYIWRSKNFLRNVPDQTGEQGTDSLVAAFQIYL